jgi:hypothetical protein
MKSILYILHAFIYIRQVIHTPNENNIIGLKRNKQLKEKSATNTDDDRGYIIVPAEEGAK